MSATKQQIHLALEASMAVADAIRELGEVAEGTLYAVLMGNMDLPAFERLVGILVGAGVVERRPNHVLKWVGPAAPPVITEKNATEHKVHSWTAEASGLGIKPGQIPAQLATSLGNKRPFKLVHPGSDRFLYRQELGCLELCIFND